MAWLEGLTAVDLGLTFANGRDFAATQEMTEELSQEVTYNGAFGTDGPVLRRIRKSDEGTLSFSAILLKAGVGNQMNNEDILKGMRDFDVICSRGDHHFKYVGCNWRRLTIRSTLDQVTLDADITVPGYSR